MFCDLKVDSPCEGSLSLKATHTNCIWLTHPDTLEDTWKLPPGFGGAANHSPPRVTLGNTVPRGKASKPGRKKWKILNRRALRNRRMFYSSRPCRASTAKRLHCSTVLFFLYPAFPLAGWRMPGLLQAKVVFHGSLRWLGKTSWRVMALPGRHWGGRND